ncbi:hypothetical protein [Acidocella sp.]|uniref:phage adaptor protein n=1 Tax=Acidocella sp. TaxID=50710 RepID=UPI002F416C45
MFNAILEELAQTYDFDAQEKFTTFNFNTALTPPATSPVQVGSGPYTMPTDFLRAEFGDVFWTLLGVPYPMIALDPMEFDMTVQQAGLQSYPYWYTVVLGQTNPGMYVYPPPSGNYPVYVRYRASSQAVAAPETNAGVPWFPSSTYLYTRLAGELMKIADDARWQAYLGEGPEGAQGILRRILPQIDNPETRAKTVKLDRRRFGSQFSILPSTKVVGWLVFLCFSLDGIMRAFQ